MFILALTLTFATHTITYFDLRTPYKTTADCVAAGEAWAKKHAEPSKIQCLPTDHPEYWRK